MQFDVLRMGKCKGAYEPFTHEKMSPEVRENYQSVVDDIYDALVQAIAVGRRMEAGKVKKLIDRGIFTAAGAQEAGLVDQVVHASLTEDKLKKFVGAGDGLKVVGNYKKKKSEEITGIMDFLKLITAGSQIQEINRQEQDRRGLRDGHDRYREEQPRRHALRQKRKARPPSASCCARWPTMRTSKPWSSASTAPAGRPPPAT